MAAAVVITVQGACASLASRWLGDPGPSQDGRTTLNPLAHLDLAGLAASLVFLAGWASPVRSDPPRFRRPRVGSLAALALVFVAVVAAGALALWLRPLALRLLAGSAAFTVSNVLDVVYHVAVRSALLGLAPLPPLVGALWLSLYRPAMTAVHGRSVRLAGSVLVLALLLTGVASPVLDGFARLLRRALGY